MTETYQIRVHTTFYKSNYFHLKWNFCPSYVTFEQKLWIDLSLESLSQWVFSSEKKDECVFFPWKENCIGIRGDWHRYYKAVTVSTLFPRDVNHLYRLRGTGQNRQMSQKSSYCYLSRCPQQTHSQVHCCYLL